MSSGLVELDLIEELKLRRWARENYTTPEKRRPDWHPIIHEEMKQKDLETVEPQVIHA